VSRSFFAVNISSLPTFEPRFAPVPIAAAEAIEETSKLLCADDSRVRSMAAARIGLIEIDLGGLVQHGSKAVRDLPRAASEYAHYIHGGVYPLGLVYLTNIAPAGASHSVATMFHAWFAHGTRWQQVTEQLPGPPPGFVVGGPNPQFSIDACCRAPPGSPAYRCYGATTFSLCQRNFTPPLAQPPAKSYLQYNDPWPATA
jgi:hypothetical protein